MKIYNYKEYLLMLLVIFYGRYSLAMSTEQSPSSLHCKKGSELQLARSKELKNLVEADQTDRKNNWDIISKKMINEITHKDLIRRKRVGVIFSEGCFQDSKDYLAAALIFQHGDTSDHYYQAFIWSKRATELGESGGQSFSALAIDRYLISTGNKQLFGSQFQKSFSSHCYCMQPVETSFPDTFRKKYAGQSLEEKYQILASINKKPCPKLECPTSLKPTPKGSIIGLW